MESAATVWFRSKVDWWLGLLLVLLPVLLVVNAYAVLQGGVREDVVAMVFALALTAAIYGLLLVPVRYGVAPDELIVRFGVVRQRIALSDITEVHPSRNPLSSPAFSLDRLAIRTGRGALRQTLISPADRETFLVTLAFHAGLEREGDRLVRTGRASGNEPV